jgi:hypothetical protein
MTLPCGCCEGVERETPIPMANRPGLSALAYRVGTHATFLETMLARLPSMPVEVEQYDTQGKPVVLRLYPLSRLTTRTPDDPAIALLDAWETVADILTFYQERMANEGYLRTATERYSILELARLVGYRLRPGVASSVCLAYTLEPGREVKIPAGSRAQSLPGPGELPQSFETSEPLHARADWNNLQVRLTQPQNIKKRGDDINTHVVYLEGTATNLKPNDPLLFVFDTHDGQQVLRLVEKVEPDAAADRTRVTLQDGTDRQRAIVADPNRLIRLLAVEPSRPSGNSVRLERSPEESFAPRAAAHLQLLTAFDPEVGKRFSVALGGARFSAQGALQSCQALRVKASLFGHNVPVQPKAHSKSGELTLYTLGVQPTVENTWRDLISDHPLSHTILLDTVYEQILPESWVAIRLPKVEGSPLSEVHLLIRQVDKAETITMAGPGFSLRVSCLHLCTPWLKEREVDWLRTDDPPSTPLLRGTSVFAQSEVLPLAEEPIETPIGCCKRDRRATPAEIELDRVHDGLDTGRWLIVSGERDIPGVAGVHDSELAMVAGLEHRRRRRLPGDRVHTFVRLSPPLSYCYKRDTVIIYGNVVEATHGETREEVLGSGDGKRGARLPTGIENVKAVYRSGIGKPGNVKEGQISLLATRPLGVKGVVNPQRASGGADPDSRDQARCNVPLAVMALDRLVSVQDYADFARSFAGIGKVSAARLTDGHRQLVHVTIAGADDILIDEGSNLYRNLLRALHDHGDPYQPIGLAVRELLLLVISGNVRLLPDYEWEAVAPRIRASLLDTFSFERRELNQDVFLSEVISTIQAVEGVDYVDVDTLAPVDEEQVKGLFSGKDGKLDLGLPPNGRITVAPARADTTVPGGCRAAQIAFLTSDVPDTLILNLVE